MNTEGAGALETAIADVLTARLVSVRPGHCVRIDDVDLAMASRLAELLAESLPTADVHVLQKKPSSARGIDSDRAVELRNRKDKPLVLLVPSGEGNAASSLDNS